MNSENNVCRKAIYSVMFIWNTGLQLFQMLTIKLKILLILIICIITMGGIGFAVKISGLSGEIAKNITEDPKVKLYGVWGLYNDKGNRNGSLKIDDLYVIPPTNFKSKYILAIRNGIYFITLVDENDDNSSKNKAELECTFIDNDNIDLIAKEPDGRIFTGKMKREITDDATDKLKQNDDRPQTIREANIPANATASDLTPPNSSFSILQLAALRGDIESLEWIIQRGLPVDHKAPKGDGSTAMHSAAGKGSIMALEWLKAHGAKINTRNMNGRTPLGIAIAQKKEDAIKWLKENGGRE